MGWYGIHRVHDTLIILVTVVFVCDTSFLRPKFVQFHTKSDYLFTCCSQVAIQISHQNHPLFN
jgi:hypothetical protein